MAVLIGILIAMLVITDILVITACIRLGKDIDEREYEMYRRWKERQK